MASPTPQQLTIDWKAQRGEIGTLCQRFGPLLEGVPEDLDPVQLMWAIALNESIHEPNGLLYFPPRFEPAYYFGGHYCLHGSAQEEAVGMYGRDAASSFGPWQVMFCHAKGFKPEEMRDLEKCALVFLGYMKRELAAQKPLTLDEIGDLYNSGNWKDKNVPVEYIARLRQHYYQDVLG